MKKHIVAGSTLTFEVVITCEKSFDLTDEDEDKLREIIYRFLSVRAKVSNED